ncbi:uncharacterized protein MELLADRAFT_102424 [Melampsora larici-populina 98AG31]|uniref:Uncharacterized protein n=1 Tax=Melampsora larici-populina (strain 98AG31 / pathotype 3-4-7) TaxID=747676 RepID=F4R891_MELLP|nr:uncharacterized protein MELLADRAFT_102424 [Melampsora larici-populina 98AG31]EGG11451.1 hypothetical protein MELLADRAFT_102424 [Melampsora larici-populina 98AG31]
MPSDSKIHIVKLNDDNYTKWKGDVTGYLMSHGLQEFLIPTHVPVPPSNDDVRKSISLMDACGCPTTNPILEPMLCEVPVDIPRPINQLPANQLRPAAPMDIELVPDIPVPPIVPMDLSTPPSTPPGQLVVWQQQQQAQPRVSPIAPIVPQKRPGWDWQPLAIMAPNDISSVVDESNILVPGTKRHRANLAQRRRARASRKRCAKALKFEVKKYENDQKLIQSNVILRNAFTPGYHLTMHPSRQFCRVEPNHQSTESWPGMETHPSLNRLTSSNQASGGQAADKLSSNSPDGSSEATALYPRGEEVVKKYVEEFNAKAFTKYIADQEEKSEKGQLSNLKKLTEASEDTTPNQFATMIHALEPMASSKILSLIKAQNSDAFHPMFTITSELKKGTKDIVRKTMKEHLEQNENFTNPAHNLWMFLRSLKHKLYQREDNKAKATKDYRKWSYNSSLLERSVKDMFKEASQKLSSEASQKGSPKTSLRRVPEPLSVNHDEDVLDKIADKMTNRIHLAMTRDGYPTLTEEKALYIRQCLASVHTFTLKYTSPMTKPLPNVISGYYSTIFHRYSGTPELSHLANRLHQKYNSCLPESERHDITAISLDDQETAKDFL